jgi:hypothetical protein
MMRLERQQLTITPKENKIYRLLCSGHSQAEVSKKLNLSSAYINQITKPLLAYSAITIFKKESNTLFYQPSLEMPEVIIEEPPLPKGRTANHCLYCNAIISNNKKFCDSKCRGHYQQGPRHPYWVENKQPKIYCWKFNKNLKKRVKAFFNYKCFACGEPHNDHKLAIHHIHYNKLAGCDGSPVFMVPLCIKCHNTTSPKTNRIFWEKLLFNQLIERTGGKCYLTKKEWRIIENKELMEQKT